MCLLMGGAVFPPCLSFGLGLLSPDEWGQIFSKWQPSGKLMLMNIPGTTASNVLPPQGATATPCFSRILSRIQGRCGPDFYGVLSLPWDPSAHEILYVSSAGGVSVSLSPVELLHTYPAGLQCQMLWGLLFPMPYHQAGEP